MRMEGGWFKINLFGFSRVECGEIELGPELIDRLFEMLFKVAIEQCLRVARIVDNPRQVAVQVGLRVFGPKAQHAKHAREPTHGQV